MIKCLTEMKGIIVNNENTCQNVTKENPVDDFICSKCGIHLFDWTKSVDEDLYEYKFKYCPNCGAKVIE